MTTAEVAAAFTELLKAGEDREAGEKFWAPDVVSRDPMEGDMAVLKGPEAIRGKHDWWNANFEVHGVTVEGPFIHGDQFALRFELDAAQKGGERQTMTEIGLYTVREGKVTEERFFFHSPGG